MSPPLPTVACPACHARMTLDVVVAHEGLTEVLKQLVNAHAEAAKLLGPLLRYAALFAPTKSEMSLDRLARVLGEIVPLIRAAKIERGGRVWAAPLERWRDAFEEMLAKREQLKLPLKSHGYLFEIVAGGANKAEASVETAHNTRLASGARDERAMSAGMAEAMADYRGDVQGPIVIDARLPKSEMPAAVLRAADELKRRRGG